MTLLSNLFELQRVEKTHSAELNTAQTMKIADMTLYLKNFFLRLSKSVHTIEQFIDILEDEDNDFTFLMQIIAEDFLLSKKKIKKEKTEKVGINGEEEPKRPLTSWNRFCSDERKRIKEEGTAEEKQNVSFSVLGQKWKDLNTNKKIKYELEYAKDKEEYKNQMKKYLGKNEETAFNRFYSHQRKKNASLSKQDAIELWRECKNKSKYKDEKDKKQTKTTKKGEMSQTAMTIFLEQVAKVQAPKIKNILFNTEKFVEIIKKKPDNVVLEKIVKTTPKKSTTTNNNETPIEVNETMPKKSMNDKNDKNNEAPKEVKETMPKKSMNENKLTQKKILDEIKVMDQIIKESMPKNIIENEIIKPIQKTFPKSKTIFRDENDVWLCTYKTPPPEIYDEAVKCVKKKTWYGEYEINGTELGLDVPTHKWNDPVSQLVFPIYSLDAVKDISMIVWNYCVNNIAGKGSRLELSTTKHMKGHYFYLLDPKNEIVFAFSAREMCGCLEEEKIKLKTFWDEWDFRKLSIDVLHDEEDPYARYR